jgi:tetratricopeptide (TPR) repeat protein
VEKLFEEGNNSYNEGDYKKAVALYQETLMLNQHSAALYFNLGNAFYRLNKVAESIYYFEKAKQLLPNDEDILVNSSFAQNMTIDAIEILPESQLEQFKNRIFNSFIFSTWTIITIVLIWLFALLFLFYIFSKSTRLKRTFFLSSLFILIFFIVSFVISFSLDQKEKQIDYAILFSNRIDVWSEPNQLGELLFSLHEGTKFQIIDDLAEWQKIRLANGSEGWVKNAYLRKLN